MADEFNTDPTSAPAEPKEASPVAAFVGSSTGRLIIGGVLLAVVLVALGAIAFYFLLNSGSESQLPPAAPGASAPATEAVAPTEPQELLLDETFTFRNIFAPTVTPPTAKESKSGSSGTTSATSNAPENTLVLTDIKTVDGERVAVFEWNGTVYECNEGEQVDDSPWEVVTIDSDSVVMLYGDSRVTLTPGQGFGDGGVLSK